MSDIDLRAEADAQAESVSDDNLRRVAELGEHQVSLQRQIEDSEAKTKNLKDELRKLSQDTLPELMREIGLLSFQLADGSGVELEPKLFGSITKANEAECFKYLEDTDNDSIIKNQFTVDFGKGEAEQADELKATLDESHYAYKQKRFVHPQTRDAWLRTERDEGRLDDELRRMFSVHEFEQSVIKKPKK